jgi:Mg2+ and Co2+ transporter CorA
MNIIVPERTSALLVGEVLAAMLVVSAVLLRWARRQGWW